MKHLPVTVASAILGLSQPYALAQSTSYGADIELAHAKKIISAAIVDSRRQKINVAIAVVDTSGLLVAFERMDDTQKGSVAVAQDKAASAALFRRSTKEFETRVAAGGVGLKLLSLRGAVPIEGGLPIIVNEKVVGAIGVSGGNSEQDGVIAKAALTAAVAEKTEPTP
jgi:glc operon protein GlcG